jgi:FKBP-type peptidyl-prolyl cis-trans isomerase FklB
MKKAKIATLFSLIMAIAISGFAQKEEISMDSISQSLGMIMGQNLKSQGFDEINAEVFAEAMSEALDETPSQAELQQANAVVSKYLTSKKETQYSDNKEKGKEFLAENKEREEVKVTDTGLQYEVIEMGDGAIPEATDKVKVHYHGTLLDGTVFDSSVQRGEPISFPVSGVIQGWQEALQMMPVGSKWKLYIPYDLAYGERGAGEDIKPYSTLIFEVELLDIVE